MSPGKKPRPERGELAKLFSRLRRDRGLTQEELAELAHIDQETIARVEQDRGPNWRRSTALEVFETLFRRLPISAEDSKAFLRLTGLDQKYYESLKKSLENESSPAVDRVVLSVSGFLSDMTRAIGPEQTIAIIRGCWITVATLGQAAKDQPIPDAKITAVFAGPKKYNRKLGAVEQTEVEYFVPPPDESPAQITRKAQSS
jgi:transcriptional regulator with XRE-family HTH domain